MQGLCPGIGTNMQTQGNKNGEEGRNGHPLDEIPMEIDILFKRLYEYRKSLIGSSHYYLKVEQGCISLCRMVYAGGKLYFSEVVNHQEYGISDIEIEEAVRLNCHNLCLADHYHISPHIEKKLRALLDFS
ncbi:MAG: hypothetical protein ABSE07_01785 [Methanoregula sp.]|jgi:hypothetical protein